jgi:mannose-1-phosphate guanylyltransferase/mannose-6-phosphate isomerase
MYSVILCGGSGTRLWPLSRKNFPKQFLKLYSDNSLLQETYLRMKKVMPEKNIFFITNEDNFFNVFNQIKDLNKNFKQSQILVEPASLNTAPAIALVCKYLEEKIKIKKDEPIFFLPADHYIGNQKKCLQIIKMAAKEVGNHIGTIGITPLRPETGYGYIKKGKWNGKFSCVEEFKEKPDKATAEKYLASGDYVWNSGMYIFNLQTFAKEIEKHSPEINKLFTKNLETFLKKFKSLPSISIDYAISEKSKNVIAFEGSFGWNDIGSFDSLVEISGKDKNSQHISIDSENVFTHSDNNRLIATLGVSDINIIETTDSILVHKRGEGENVKKIVEHLKSKKSKELSHNLIVHRPWGKYEVLIDGPRHKVKRITVYPGSKLSLQSHKFRAEHWVVIKGKARVVNGENLLVLRENESTYIKAHSKHRLSNPGKINLEIIEVQTGSYLEEDDIKRYEDIYNRKN